MKLDAAKLLIVFFHLCILLFQIEVEGLDNDVAIGPKILLTVYIRSLRKVKWEINVKKQGRGNGIREKEKKGDNKYRSEKSEKFSMKRKDGKKM